ncbi:MAG TPA: hypothetical protein VFM87_00070, partial [Agrococcus sp.]|nr:hypothetical protein [Agrococcus sp.]
MPLLLRQASRMRSRLATRPAQIPQAAKARLQRHAADRGEQSPRPLPELLRRPTAGRRPVQAADRYRKQLAGPARRLRTLRTKVRELL